MTAIVVAIIAVAVAMGAQQGIKAGYNGYVAAVESWNHAHGSDNDKEDNKINRNWKTRGIGGRCKQQKI